MASLSGCHDSAFHACGSCVAAAAAISLLGDWAWSLSAALAAMALACGSRGQAYPPNSADL
jgi:hypothetical protein